MFLYVKWSGAHKTTGGPLPSFPSPSSPSCPFPFYQHCPWPGLRFVAFSISGAKGAKGGAPTAPCVGHHRGSKRLGHLSMGETGKRCPGPFGTMWDQIWHQESQKRARSPACHHTRGPGFKKWAPNASRVRPQGSKRKSPKGSVQHGIA